MSSNSFPFLTNKAVVIMERLVFIGDSLFVFFVMSRRILFVSQSNSSYLSSCVCGKTCCVQVAYMLTYPSGKIFTKTIRVLKDGQVQIIHGDPPDNIVDCRASMTRSIFLDVYWGRLHPQTAVMSGIVSVANFAYRHLFWWSNSFDLSAERWDAFYAKKAAEDKNFKIPKKIIKVKDPNMIMTLLRQLFSPYAVVRAEGLRTSSTSLQELSIADVFSVQNTHKASDSRLKAKLLLPEVIKNGVKGNGASTAVVRRERSRSETATPAYASGLEFPDLDAEQSRKLLFNSVQSGRTKIAKARSQFISSIFTVSNTLLPTDVYTLEGSSFEAETTFPITFDANLTHPNLLYPSKPLLRELANNSLTLVASTVYKIDQSFENGVVRVRSLFDELLEEGVSSKTKKKSGSSVPPSI